MPDTKHPPVPGGTYFFDLRLQDPSSRALTENIDILRMSIRCCMTHWPFRIHEAAVLPAQLLIIITLPEGDADYAKRWRLIKSVFSRHVDGPAIVSPRMQLRREKGIWRKRFAEHLIRNAADMAWYRAYVLDAPVREGIAASQQEWPHSSIHRRQRTLVHASVTLAAE